VGFGDHVTDLLSGADCLVEVGVAGGVVAALGGVPDELAHQDGGLGDGRRQFSLHPARGRVVAQEHGLAVELARLGQQQRGGYLVVLLIQALHLLA
jgi:hypothetical protein